MTLGFFILGHDTGGTMPESTNVTPWRTAKQAATRALVSVKVIYREVGAKRLRHARVGGRRELRFLDTWVDEWLAGTAEPVEVRAAGRPREQSR